MSWGALFMLLFTLYEPFSTRDIRWRASRNRGHPGMVYFVVRASLPSLIQQSTVYIYLIYSLTLILVQLLVKGLPCCTSKSWNSRLHRNSVAITAGMKWERVQLIRCQSKKLVIYSNCPVDASIITALSQPHHHKHTSPDWAGADGERDRACVAILGCQ